LDKLDIKHPLLVFHSFIQRDRRFSNLTLVSRSTDACPGRSPVSQWSHSRMDGQPVDALAHIARSVARSPAV
jgi:hypothetical protein